MSTRTPTLALSFLLAVSLIAPSAFFIAPQRVEAQGVGVPIIGIGPNEFTTSIKSTVSAIQNTLNTISTYTNTAANYAKYINDYYLQPLAFIMSGQLMKALTASVLQFVIGKANGTGIPQFVTDVRQSLQSISNFQAQAYFRQVSLTNSPFATSIAQSLGIDYNQKTTLAGFWAANMNTLGRGIPTYNNSYLAGNWSAGGIGAWFQLTTQSQNNPYLLYQNTQAQLQTQIGRGVGGSTGARLAELQQNQGFLSWCGALPSDEKAQNAVATDFAACRANGISEADCTQASGGASAEVQGINPGDACTDKDGNPGTVRTPGSVIKATLDKVLGSQQERLIGIGNISTQVNSILGNIGTVLNTINLARNILGGDSGGISSGGLLGAGSSSGALTRFGSGSYGVTESQIQQGIDSSEVTAARNVSTTSAVAAIPSYSGDPNNPTNTSGTAGSDMPARIQKFETAWSSIALSANMASSTLQSMMAVCRSYWNGNSTYETAAWNALSSKVAPILTQAAGIKAITDAAKAQYDLVRSMSSSSSTYDAEVQKLNNMSPTGSDVATAEYNATAYGAATANPTGSYSVSGGSIVDQMNLIRNNATAIQTSACTTPPDYGGGA